MARSQGFLGGSPAAWSGRSATFACCYVNQCWKLERTGAAAFSLPDEHVVAIAASEHRFFSLVDACPGVHRLSAGAWTGASLARSTSEAPRLELAHRAGMHRRLLAAQLRTCQQ